VITKHLLPAPYTKCASLFKTPHTAFAALLIPTLPTEIAEEDETRFFTIFTITPSAPFAG
jgi:hypothetical protein